MNIANLADERTYSLGRGKRDIIRPNHCLVIPIPRFEAADSHRLNQTVPAIQILVYCVGLFLALIRIILNCVLHWLEPRLLFRHLWSLQMESEARFAPVRL